MLGASGMIEQPLQGIECPVGYTRARDDRFTIPLSTPVSPPMPLTATRRPDDPDDPEPAIHDWHSVARYRLVAQPGELGAGFASVWRKMRFS
ncbi:hypothetical protein P0F65_04460 [Sphingomonas sp. I4]